MIYARFKGHRRGEFLGGIPARSLTRDEFDALDVDQRAAVRESDLYAIDEPPKAEAPAKDAPKADAAKADAKGGDK